MSDRAVFVVALADAARNAAAKRAMQAQFPEAHIVSFPDCTDDKVLAKATALLVWNPDPKLLALMPKLDFVQSYGAGVDHLLPYWDQLSRMSVARFVDPSLSENMSHYVINQILNDQLHATSYADQQRQSVWRPHVPREGNRVLVMGLGTIGQKVADDLLGLGYQVTGWSRTPKPHTGYPTLSGLDALQSSLAHMDYVVNILPLTPDTRQLVNAHLMGKMTPDCCFINVGRGATVDTTALIGQLDQGLLRKAVLDVFEREPLAADHPAWLHPKLVLTPHIASITNIEQVVAVFAENQRRRDNGKPILYGIDMALGY
jgi:glyoxylate/hydroxypyruvate reductase A